MQNNNSNRKGYDREVFTPFSTILGEKLCQIQYDGKSYMMAIESKDFPLEVKRVYRRKKRKAIEPKQLNDAIEEMRQDAYENKLDYRLESRIFNMDDGSIVYNLDPATSTSVWLHEGMAELAETPDMMFQYDSTLLSQPEPDLKEKPGSLPKLLKRHFHLKREEDVILLALYIVSSMAGNKLPHHILILSGSKGAGKSFTAGLIARIVDPHSASLFSLPKNGGDLALRFYNSYLLILDNITYLKDEYSRLIAMSVTGGSYPKRMLFEDSKEVLLDLRCLLVLTGIEIAAKEPDVLDRSILIELERIKPDEIRTEACLEKKFEADLPKILGACFKLLANAEADTDPVEMPKTRMADAFELMVKIGRAMGYEDEYISGILWKNQRLVNLQVVFDDVLGECVIEYMEKYQSFEGSVTEFMHEIEKVAKKIHIDKKKLPLASNAFSRRLNRMQSNLENEFGIQYNIKNTGRFQKITIFRN